MVLLALASGSDGVEVEEEDAGVFPLAGHEADGPHNFMEKLFTKFDVLGEVGVVVWVAILAGGSSRVASSKEPSAW